MNSNPLRTSSVTIPAGTVDSPGSIVAGIAGQVFIAYSASGAFKMQFDSRGVFDCLARAVVPVTGGFNNITFFNATAQPIVVVFGCGATGISFLSPDTLKTAATFTKGTNLFGVTQIGAGLGVTFSGMNGNSQRKQITVQNLDPGLNLEVRDGSNVPLAVISPNSYPWTLETSGIVTVFNPNLSALYRVVVGETFYL